MNKKKNNPVKTARVRYSPSKLSIAAPERTRLVLSITEEEKKYIKVLAAMENKTITDYLLESPRKKMPKMRCPSPGCDGAHIPNKKTAKVLKDSEAGINLESHDNLDDFWEAMGMNPNAKD
jgi:hypothetical protein